MLKVPLELLMEQTMVKVNTLKEIDLAAHGPKWLVGRSGRTRKTEKGMLPKLDNKNSADLAAVKNEIAAKMEEKMNQKLKKILGRLAEKNPFLEINVADLCADTSFKDGDTSDEENEMEMVHV